MKTGYLVLENGNVFKGFRFGADVPAVGELVFTTGVCGYVETLTDPSYAGQIVMQTFPLIGNYGIIAADFEGNCAVRGYIVREWCDTPSNFRSGGDVDAFLKERGIPGLWGLDTRQLTRILREAGVMNAMICDEIPEDLTPVKTYEVRGVVAQVSSKAPQTYAPEGELRYRVALMDYGYKGSILKELRNRGCEVTVYPYDTPAEAVLAADPDGIMLSNGPGDPQENTYSIQQLRLLLGKKPIFAICLGHQLLALAAGGKTVKLKYGHRGGNQPVRELGTARTYITSQNHGYAVVAESLAGTAKPWFINNNDGTCEGLEYPGLNAFTVQFHPEACSGPRDTGFLFDRFIAQMGGEN